MFGIFDNKKNSLSEQKPIYLYNSATKQKEVFVPLKPGHVTMYSCGPTVYDHIHIGNLRSFLLPDLLKRVFLYNGYSVNNTINFTDFGHLTDDGDEGEDKMMNALKRQGKPITLSAMREMAQVYIDSFIDDNIRFQNLEPTQYTPASEFIEEQIGLIKTLVEKGYAYETASGVYFDITKFPKYGILGNVDVSKMRDGARVEVNPEKRHPADFALWKKGLLGWESDWGKGFPGWHIECTAMAFATLGKQIDIHTGGEDLKYTHHNGEIAQAEAATGKKYVSYWLHSAFVTIDDSKIAKSLGNGVRLSQLEDRGYSPLTYRYWLLTSHYRSQTNFTFEALGSAKQALFRLKRFIFEDCKNEKGTVNKIYQERLVGAIHDDLDTAKAIAIIWELVKDPSIKNGDKVATLRDIDAILGLGLADDAEKVVRELGILGVEDVPEDIQELVDKREAARMLRNWDEADHLREAINLKGYTVEDTPNGPRVGKA